MTAWELSKTILKNSPYLKALYRFESGALTTDDSGNGYTLTNNNSVAEASGKYGGGADFGTGNTNKSLTIANHLGNDGGTCSINLWINTPTTTSSNDHESLAGVFNGTVHSGFYITLGNTGVRASRLKSGVAWEDTSEVAFSANEWHMVTLTCDATTLRLYVDGLYRASVGVVGNGVGAVSSLTSIGTRADSGATYADGIIDDVAFFNSTLTADQIKELYEGRYIGEWTPQSGVAAIYHLNGSSTDTSGNNNHGTDTAITYDTAHGRFGRGPVFNGSTSKIALPTTQLAQTGDFSVLCWFKRTGAAFDTLVQCFNQYSSDAAYQGWVLADIDSNGKIKFRTGNTTSGTSENLETTNTLNDGKWHLLVATYNVTSKEKRLYVDGVLNNSNVCTQGIGYTSAVGRIGSYIRNGTDYQVVSANASIDEVAIFSRVLTAAEIRHWYAWSVGKYL